MALAAASADGREAGDGAGVFWHGSKARGGWPCLRQVMVTPLFPVGNPRAASSPGLQHHAPTSKKGEKREKAPASRCTWGRDLSRGSERPSLMMGSCSPLPPRVCSWCFLTNRPGLRPNLQEAKVFAVPRGHRSRAACVNEHLGSKLESTKLRHESPNTH